MRQILSKKISEFLAEHKRARGALVGVIVLLGLGAAGYAVYMQREENALNTEEKVQNFNVDADERAFSGDIDGTLRAYDEAIAKQPDDRLRADLLINKARVAVNNGRQDVAIDAARQADEIKSTLATSSMLAQLYDKRGDRDQAIAYYRKSIQQLDTSQDEMDSSDKGYFERRIKELEAAR